MNFQPHPDAEARIASAKCAIKALLVLDLYPSHKREFLTIGLWKLTEAEAHSKYKTRYQSTGAMETTKEKLQHEHVVQRKRLIDELLMAPENADAILDQAVGCTVTVSEHERLSKIGRLHPDLDG